MEEELVTRSVALPAGDLRLLQPAESAELPDDGGVEWAPLAPYWSVLWRSGVALAAEVATAPLRGARVVELGCGLGAPSISASRAGARVLATDREEEALSLLRRNAVANGAVVETAAAGWEAPSALLSDAPFDLALAADVLYEGSAVEPLLDLLPRLAPEAWLADPGRAPARTFLARARERWEIESSTRGVVSIHRLRRDGEHDPA